MKETKQHRAPGSASRVWVVFKRILLLIVVLIAVIGFVVNTAGLVGIWAVRRPACDVVTTLSTSVNNKLEVVDRALARVRARVDESREALLHVNDVANKLGDRLEQNSPMVEAVAGAARDELAPKIAETRAQAAALRDSAVSVNAALETVDSLGFIEMPALGDELSAVSERVDAAQTDVQELRAAVDEAKTTASPNVVAALTARTMKIDNRLAQVKSTTVNFQAVVEQKQQQLADLSRTVLLAINLLVLSLTAFFLVGAAGQMLLIYICWQYARRGRFPLLHVASRK